jgi:hypothetical protein
MPLPTTNLTLNLDASDTDNLFTTWADGGGHSGTPADGNAVQVWRRESDGSVTPCNAAYSGGAAPAYRSTTPLMLLPCLDFDGTDDEMRVVSDATVTSYRDSSQFFSTTARTILGAFYAESITATNAGAAGGFSNQGVTAGDDNWYINVYNSGGQRKLQLGAHDGSWKMVEVNIGEGATHVFKARHDGTNLYLAVDGGAESSVACGTISGSSSQVRIGSSGDSVRFNGRIGQLAYYSTSDLTQANSGVTFLREKWQGVTSGVYRPNGDNTTTNWSSTAGTFFSVLDEETPSDADYVTSPTITGTGVPLICTLSNGPLSAGTWTVPLRANTSAGTATLRVSLVNDSNASQGSVDITGVTTTITRYDPQITTTGAATRIQFEFVTS